MGSTRYVKKTARSGRIGFLFRERRKSELCSLENTIVKAFTDFTIFR
jgi:hypothetical protein